MKKHTLIVTLPVLLLSLFQTFSAYASSDERLDHFLSLSLEDLISLETSIASASKQTMSKAPAVVTLITEDDIKATGATNLVDVLEGVPGIHIRYSHFANRPLVHFRGANATQTLLMVNGSPMKDLMWGFGFFWKGLPASMIDRVEIIRGPGSALFGADASAGVINIITKTAGKIQHSEAGIRVGSFNSKTAWMQHGDNWNGFDIGITAELYSTDGHDPFIPVDGQTGADTANGTNVSLAPGNAHYGWRNEDIRFSIAKGHWRLHSDYMRRSDLDIGLTGAGVLDQTTQASDRQYNLDLFYENEQFSENWGLEAELRYQYLDYTSGDGFQERPAGYSDGTVYADGLINQMRSAERRLIFEVSGLYSGIKNHTIRLGTGHNWQDLYLVEQFVNYGTGADGNPITPGDPLVNLSGSPYAFAPEKTRNISYLFLQDIWAISNDLELTLGARYDHYSDFGGTFNPRLAMVWQSTQNLTTKIMYGRAFRAPSYQELFALTSNAAPNADLDPERSQTMDLVFSYAATNDLQLNLNMFYFEQSDLIVKTGSPTQFQNDGDHSTRGAELEAQWQAMKDLIVSGNYTLRSHDNNTRSFDEPNEEAYLRIDWGFISNWNWNLQANWIGERPRNTSGNNPDTRPVLDDHLITDTTLRYSHSNDIEFAVSVRNVFDADAREYTGRSIPDDLPLAERNVYAEMRYKF